MKKIIAQAKRFLRDEEGVTAIEYALVASLVALAIITALTGLGTGLKDAFDAIATSV